MRQRLQRAIVSSTSMHRPARARPRARRARGRRPRSAPRRRRRPPSSAAAAKSAPSNRSPRIATNSSPAPSVRVSIDTPVNSRARVARRRRAPPIASATHDRAVSAASGSLPDTTAGLPCIDARVGPALQRLARHRHVVERQHAVADHLVLLVSLAGDQHEIAGPRQLDRLARSPRADRRSSAAAGRCRGACRRVRPAANLLDDPDRILGARIVRRHDDQIAQPAGDGAHQRTLGPIAIAAAAEHRDQRGRAPAGARSRAGCAARRRCARSRRRR